MKASNKKKNLLMCLYMNTQMPLLCYVSFVENNMVSQSLPIHQLHMTNIICDKTSTIRRHQKNISNMSIRCSVVVHTQYVL